MDKNEITLLKEDFEPSKTEDNKTVQNKKLFRKKSPSKKKE
jgi:hypothetical protein